jgi:hypothetical protein
MVLTASGESKPVRWLGHRALDCSRHPDPAQVWPIQIQAGAFAEGQPERDLWLSPGHSVLIDGVLVPAGKLVNGRTICQVRQSRLEYWHVELDEHDVLLAEGLPAESYLDTGNRSAFINGAEQVQLHPELDPNHWTDTCAPLILEGPQLADAKRKLLERAQSLGHLTTQESDVHLLADGRRIDPVPLPAKRLAFVLPEAAQRIELRSRYFAPGHTDPKSNDTRSLGICIHALQLDGVEVALDAPLFAEGWHALEGKEDGACWRWSTSGAHFPAGTRLIVLQQGGSGTYWQEPASAPALVRSA